MQDNPEPRSPPADHHIHELAENLPRYGDMRALGGRCAAHCCVSTPLLLATCPCRRGSASVAIRSARANALNVASTM